MVGRKKIVAKVIIGSVFLGALLYGCHPIQNQLYGSYASNDKGIVDSLFLYKNQHYLHKILIGNHYISQNGQWSYSFGTIHLYDFRSYAVDSPQVPAIRITEVDICYNGAIEIEINSDSDIYYLKVNKK